MLFYADYKMKDQESHVLFADQLCSPISVNIFNNFYFNNTRYIYYTPKSGSIKIHQIKCSKLTEL